MSNFNSKSYLYSSMGSPSFSPHPAAMCIWKREALKFMRQKLGRVTMDVVMIKKLEKSDISSPDNIGFLSHEQLQEVESKRTPTERMNKVIDYLLEMEDIYFENFCKILKDGNFELKANELKNRAEKEYERYVGKLNMSNTLACTLTLQRPVACKLRNVNWLMMSHPDYCLDCIIPIFSMEKHTH